MTNVCDGESNEPSLMSKCEFWNDLPLICKHNVFVFLDAGTLYILYRMGMRAILLLPSYFWQSRIEEFLNERGNNKLCKTTSPPHMTYFKIALPLCFCCGYDDFLDANGRFASRMWDMAIGTVFGFYVCERCRHTDERIKLVNVDQARHVYRLGPRRIKRLVEKSGCKYFKQSDVEEMYEAIGGDKRVMKLDKAKEKNDEKRAQRDKRLLEEMIDIHRVIVEIITLDEWEEYLF